MYNAPTRASCAFPLEAIGKRKGSAQPLNALKTRFMGLYIHTGTETSEWSASHSTHKHIPVKNNIVKFSELFAFIYNFFSFIYQCEKLQDLLLLLNLLEYMCERVRSTHSLVAAFICYLKSNLYPALIVLPTHS